MRGSSARRARTKPSATKGKPQAKGVNAEPRAAGTRAKAHAAGTKAKPQAAGAKGPSDEKRPKTRPLASHKLPRELPEVASTLSPGQVLLTCRAGAERDVIDELLIARVKHMPQQIGDALVVSAAIPKRDRRPIELAFARQGFPILALARGDGPLTWAERLAPPLLARLEGRDEYALQVWSPDSDPGNRLSAEVEQLDALLSARLSERRPALRRIDDSGLRRAQNLLFAQAALIDPHTVALGVTHTNQALSLAPGGRSRVRLGGPIPSRSARKLEEAFAWLGVAPGPGELCVDLGAAPGGWTYVLSERRARVIAVDPGELRAELQAKRSVRHVPGNAFTYTPEEPADWLFCDMAYRPLEVAALLAKWGRRRWARILVANIKLPMTRKAELLERVKHILRQEGDFKNVRARQLYHDRDEVTVSAHVG